jgi:hypothetical protein
VWASWGESAAIRPSTPATRFKCRACGLVLPAWIQVLKELDGAMLLQHLGQHHPTEVGRYLDQMRGSEDIAEVAIQAFEVIEEDSTKGRYTQRGAWGLRKRANRRL